MDALQRALRRAKWEARKADPDRDVKLLAAAGMTFIGGLTLGFLWFVIGNHLSWQFRLATSLIVCGVGGGLELLIAALRENTLQERRESKGDNT